MMADLKKKTYIIILLTIVLLTISICLNFYLYFLREPLVKEVKTEIEKKDTIVTFKKNFDTVFVCETKYNDIYHFDTIHVKDKVYIQDTLKNYSFNEKEYDLNINAVKLENYKLDIHTKDTIKFVQTINTVTYKQRSNKPQIGIFGGVGYDIKGKTFGPQIGIGVVFPLTKW